MITYAYDGLQRLIGTVEAPGNSFAYTYDLAGNRTAVQVNGAAPAITTYNLANQITNAGYSYDLAGNLTNDGTATYTYDALNRTTARGGTTYAYNGDGVLVSQLTAGVTTRYTQDLAAPLTQVLQTFTGTPRTDYLYGLSRLATLTSGVRTWYVSDALGSVRRTVTDAGVPLGVISYDPWGSVESGSVPTFGFTGELQDPVTGLVNLRARWYSTGQGRFASVDPFAGAAETPYSLHPYQYAYSAPTVWTDPSGRVVSDGDGKQGCLWDIELGRCRAEVEDYARSSAGHGSPIIINIDLNSPLIFTQPNRDSGREIFTQPIQDSRREIFTPNLREQGQLIFTNPEDPFTCLIFVDTTDIEKQLGIIPDYVTSNNSPRRPGVPPRADGGWQKGQLTDDEYEFLQSLAKRWGRDIVLTGSLSETDLGLQNRHNPNLREKLPPFRQNKPESDLVKIGKGDIDIWQGSGLNDSQLNELLLGFNILNGQRNEWFKLDEPSQGYNLRRYPDIRYFGRKAGAIVFAPDGTTVRIPAPWQYKGWPENYADYAHPRPGDDVG